MGPARGGAGGDAWRAALYAACEAELPPYARPLFARLLPSAESLATTATFKYQRAALRAAGADPAALSADERAAGGALFFADAAAKAFVPLDAALWARIARGEVRL